MHRDPELDIVAAALARVTKKGVEAWRAILIAAVADPTFQASSLLITLPTGAAPALLGILRDEAPQAMSWLMAGCRRYSAKDQMQRNRMRW